MATDFVLRAGKSSAILDSLNQGGLESLEYNLPKTFPLLVPEKLPIGPVQEMNGSSLYGYVSRFDIPRSTLLRNLLLRTSFTVDSGAATLTTGAADLMKHALVGANLIESIELRTRSRSICILSQDYIRAWAETCPQAKSLEMQYRMKMLDPTTGVLLGGITLTDVGTFAAITYTPIPMYFTEMIESGIDTGFCEQLQLVVRYNSQANSGIARPVLGTSNILYSWFWQPEATYFNSLRSKNFGRALPLTQLIYDTITETTVATSTTVNTVKIRTNNPTFMTIMDILNNQTSLNALRFAIDSYTIKFTNRAIDEDIPLLVGSYEQAWNGSSCCGYKRDETTGVISVVRNTASPMIRNWGLDYSKVFNSGAVSFSQIDSPTVTINTQALTTAANNWNINLTHLFWSLLSTDGSNGAMIVSSAT